MTKRKTSCVKSSKRNERNTRPKASKSRSFNKAKEFDDEDEVDEDSEDDDDFEDDEDDGDDSETPNIFDYATTELSQDAFFAWLLSWADKKYAKEDKELHDCAQNFLKSLYGDSLQNPIETVEVCTQYKHIDIWVQINKEFNLIIEDKVNTKFHKGQLADYKKVFEEISEKKKRFVYLKTGKISKNEQKTVCDYYEYSVVSAKDILSIFDKHNNISNSFYQDFKNHLKATKLRNEMYEHFEKPDKKKYTCKTYESRCLGFWFKSKKFKNQYLAIDVWISAGKNKLTFLLHGKKNNNGKWLGNKNKLNNLINKLTPNILKDKKIKFKGSPSNFYTHQANFVNKEDAIEKTEEIINFLSENLEQN